MKPGKENAVVTEDFTRYEFKYLLKADESKALEEEVSHFMSVDSHVAPELEQQYYVRSLYFDTPGSHCFYEKIDGIKSRRKFRLRTYARSVHDPAPLYIEIKGRHNERTYKHRVRINRETLPLFLDTTRSYELLSLFPGVEVVNQFVCDVARRRIKPMVLIDYQRRPYTSVFDINFRMTFDEKITSTTSEHLFPKRRKLVSRSCVAGWTILEVKFNRRIPAWFHRILQAHSMRRISVSKFVLGMERCGLAIDLS